MSPRSSAFRIFLRLLRKSQRELNASLLFAALTNRVAFVRALVDLGADIHTDSDRAIRTAGNLGYFELFSLLLTKYDPVRDLAVLRDLRLRLIHLSAREKFLELLDPVICGANVVSFAQKRQRLSSPAAA